MKGLRLSNPFQHKAIFGGDAALALHTQQPDLAGKPETETFKFN